jgi:hypothetical protein
MLVSCVRSHTARGFPHGTEMLMVSAILRSEGSQVHFSMLKQGAKYSGKL